MRTILAAVVATHVARTAYAEKLTLVKDGKTAWEICYDDCNPATQAAAQELQWHIREMTGVVMPVCSQRSVGPRESRIILGAGGALPEAGTRFWAMGFDKSVLAGLGDEGYIIKAVGQHIIIAGAEDVVTGDDATLSWQRDRRYTRGTLHGVYDFIENALGCKHYTRFDSVIPKVDEIVIDEKIDVRYVPPFEYREIWSGATSPDWAVRNHLNRYGSRMARKQDDDWMPSPYHIAADKRLTDAWKYAGTTLAVHTLPALIPVVVYFKKHPEWWGMVDGKRYAEHPGKRKGLEMQLCFTNKAMQRQLVKNVKELLKITPDANIIHLGPADMPPETYCQCANCKKMMKASGGRRSGALAYIACVVADGIKKDFPNVRVEMMAYGSTRAPYVGKHAPKLPDNAIVTIANSGSCCYHTFGEDIAPMDELKRWTKLSPAVWVWFYSQGFVPMFVQPNLRRIGPQMREFRDVGVKGIYYLLYQFGPNTPWGFLDQLETWLAAKLMWNPDLDQDALVREWADAVCGPGADEMVEFYRLTQDPATYKCNANSIDWIPQIVPESRQKGYHLGPQSKPELADNARERLLALTREGERKCAKYPQARMHFTMAKAAVLYSILYHGKRDDPVYLEALKEAEALFPKHNKDIPDVAAPIPWNARMPMQSYVNAAVKLRDEENAKKN